MAAETARSELADLSREVERAKLQMANLNRYVPSIGHRVLFLGIAPHVLAL